MSRNSFHDSQVPDIDADLAATVPHRQAVVHQLTVLGVDVLSRGQACTSGLENKLDIVRSSGPPEPGNTTVQLASSATSATAREEGRTAAQVPFSKIPW